MTSSAGPGELRLGIDTTVNGPNVRICIRGEADISTIDPLETALADVELNGARSVTLDVTDLGFVDAATIRRLTVFALQAKETGHDVTTCGASPTFRTVAGLLGLRDHLGLL